MFRGVDRLRFDTEAEEYASKFWKLLVEKVGEFKAKSIMLTLMGDEKPGPKNPKERLLNDIIRSCLHQNGGESDEKIAKRILARKPCWVRYDSGHWGFAYGYELSGDDLIDIDALGDGEYVIDVIVEQKPIEKGLKSLKKRVQRIRRELIEGGELPKEFAPRKYNPG
jgi:hypothetical protein